MTIAAKMRKEKKKGTQAEIQIVWFFFSLQDYNKY
jgi:hypothetical protein